MDEGWLSSVSSTRRVPRVWCSGSAQSMGEAGVAFGVIGHWFNPDRARDSPYLRVCRQGLTRDANVRNLNIEEHRFTCQFCWIPDLVACSAWVKGEATV